MTKRSIAQIIGFLMFLLGSLSLILDFVHVKLIIMYPIDSLGMYWALLIKLLMFIFGLMIVYIIRLNDRII